MLTRQVEEAGSLQWAMGQEDSVACRWWKPECSGFEYRTEIAEMEFPLKKFGREGEERIKERAGMKAGIPEWQEGQCGL